MRPERLVLVAGTGTGVGKTWVAAALARRLRERGMSVAARKPVQSFEPGGGPTDAEVLAAATGAVPEEVCPPERWLPMPMAPPIAAEILGTGSFTVADLLAELRWPPSVDVGLVESVGGVRSPIAEEGDTVELAAALSPDLVVLVADARLGAINAVLSALPPLARWPTVVLLNRFDPGDDVHRHNLRWLSERQHLDAVTGVDELAARVLPPVPLETP